MTPGFGVQHRSDWPFTFLDWPIMIGRIMHVGELIVAADLSALLPGPQKKP